jgi:hypothetical protein
MTRHMVVINGHRVQADDGFVCNLQVYSEVGNAHGSLTQDDLLAIL